MTPNNNLSILPWYESIDEQNARKWWVYGRVYPLFTPAGYMPPFQIMRRHKTGPDAFSFKLYTKDGVLVGDYTQKMLDCWLSVKEFAVLGYDVIIFGGQVRVFDKQDNGQYYATLSDGINTWYSEVFTAVNDIQPYLRLEWWDVDDFTMDAGTIVYQYKSKDYDVMRFRNVLYLHADLAKPEYPFEEEGTIRDGYFFPVKQISEKRYRFAFFASEYLLDVMRFVRMADYAYVIKDDKRYRLDSFLITPEWEDNGDVAAVEAEFETDTVAKKLGRFTSPGDFNEDFNFDFFIQP